ncbi:hypothetical protein OWM54_34795 [Myxococcus sp. MISCRS1]|uniref:hypothetical protein n=1 Tax=Myxococcus sp. MISCRS1 TaxID=2996786 RepID=UPI00226EFEF6|nr:hypothetical protein [Myxococcus sp. MISCRS1]MCY1002335.1 hypothetical protein [Myxococcus sp. MISCRS1]
MTLRGRSSAPASDGDWSEPDQSLVTAWRLDTLAVLADRLQQRGDPRGELMALDLNPKPEDRGWRHRRQAVLAAGEHEDLAFDASGALAEAVETLLDLEDLGREFFPEGNPFAHDGLGALEAALGSPLDSSPAHFHLVWGS